MKISAIKTYAVKVGIRNQLLVKVETDEAIVGWGKVVFPGVKKPSSERSSILPSF